MFKVAVIGNGGREHALRVAIAKTATLVDDPNEACLVVVGPEGPLVDGLADKLRADGKPVYGPGADGARIEGSKQFMKDFVARAGVPTARYKTVDNIDDARAFIESLNGGAVVKTDGLAAGKGVFVTTDAAAAIEDAEQKLSGAAFAGAGSRVVIEELMTGPEVSVMFAFDSKEGLALPPAQDFKRIFNSDEGANTGGMGAYSPVPLVDDRVMKQIHEQILWPTAEQLQRERIDYRGTLFAGLMLTAEGPKLIEYNVRFGDPETQVILPCLDGDVAEFLASVAHGKIDTSCIEPRKDFAVTVTLASEGYPQSSRNGDVITGIDEANEIDNVQVYEAGTSRENGVVATAGGRVLNVTAIAPTLDGARKLAYSAVEKIHFEGMQYRTDIAEQAAASGL